MECLALKDVDMLPYYYFPNLLLKNCLYDYIFFENWNLTY